MISVTKQQMCEKKESFRSQGLAQKCADKYGQRIYECPICFCWHCTTKKKWEDEFVGKEVMVKRLLEQDRALKKHYEGQQAEKNEKLRMKNEEIMALKKELSVLKKTLSTDGKSNDR